MLTPKQIEAAIMPFVFIRKHNHQYNTQDVIHDCIAYVYGERRPSRFKTSISSAKNRVYRAGLTAVPVAYNNGIERGKPVKKLVLSPQLKAYYRKYGEHQRYSTETISLASLEMLKRFNDLMQSLCRSQPVWKY